MLTNAESSPASPIPTRVVHECDFCGRAVHKATAVHRSQTEGNEREAIPLCLECAAGVD